MEPFPWTKHYNARVQVYPPKTQIHLFRPPQAEKGRRSFDRLPLFLTLKMYSEAARTLPTEISFDLSYIAKRPQSFDCGLLCWRYLFSGLETGEAPPAAE